MKVYSINQSKHRIVIGFSRRNSLFSLLIRLVTWSKVSHTYIQLYSPRASRYLIYEATPSGTKFTNLDHFVSKHEVVWEKGLTITDEQYKSIMQFCIDNLDRKYDWRDVFWIFINKVKGLFTERMVGPTTVVNSYICSELVARILTDCLGYVITNTRGEDISDRIGQLSPEDIYKFIILRAEKNERI